MEGLDWERGAAQGDDVRGPRDAVEVLARQYPRFGGKIRELYAAGRPIEDIAGKLYRWEAEQLKSRPLGEVRAWLGRGADGAGVARERMERAKADAYAQALNGRLTHEEIGERIFDARMLGMPDGMLLEDDELYRMLVNRIGCWGEGRAGRLDAAKALAVRVLANLDAGIVGATADNLAGIAWLWDEYSSLVNETANAVSKKVIGRPLVYEESNVFTTTLHNLAEEVRNSAREYAQVALGERGEADILDKTLQAVGSAGVAALAPAAFSKIKTAGITGAAAMTLLTKGGLNAVSEGAKVFSSQLYQGADLGEARSAARKTALMQFPVDFVSEALASYIGADVKGIRKVMSNGLNGVTKQTLQKILLEFLGQRNPEERSYTWGDLAAAMPELMAILPATVMEEGIPAFLSEAFLGQLISSQIKTNALELR